MTADDVAPSALSACGEIVRQSDKDRFLTVMTARSDMRDDLFALYAFNFEIAKISEVVSETTLGHIRLQWWRDAIEECFNGTPRRHVVVKALAETIQDRGLPREAFDTAINARERDLDPGSTFNGLDDLRLYAKESSGSISKLAAVVAGSRLTEDLVAAERVGTAWALVGMMRAIPFTIRNRRVDIPDALIGKHGVSRVNLVEGRQEPNLPKAVEEICALAAAELSNARERRGFAPRGVYGALSLGVLADSYLRQLRRCKYDPFNPNLATPGVLRTWSLLVRSFGERF